MEVNLNEDKKKLYQSLLADEFPDEKGRFGPFGGRYIPETLVPAFTTLEAGVKQYLNDPKFIQEWQAELNSWVGRPTALTFAPRLSASWGAEVWLKREDLAHTGAHKINNAMGQILLAKRMKKTRIIAETGTSNYGRLSILANWKLDIKKILDEGGFWIDRGGTQTTRRQRNLKLPLDF